MSKLQSGPKPKDRKLATKPPTHTKVKKLTANQWQNTPQQNQYMEYWINPESQTFGNAYQSALKAKYSPHYANRIAAQSMDNKWIAEYRRKLDFGPEHIKQGIQKLAIKANNSRSPDDTRLNAYETLAKIHGMLNNTSQVTVNVVQPILAGQSVERKQVDVEQG